MKKGKKLTAAMTAYAVVASMVVPTAFAGTASFTDINDSFAKDAILKLADAGILNGVGNGKFNPTGQIERQDFAIILAKALNLDTASAPATATFSDIPKDHYAFAAVEACVKAGLIKGVGDGQYGNGTNLSREDMAVMFGRALNLVAGKDIITGKAEKLNFTDAADIADYAKDAVGAAFELGYISGSNGKFDPKGTATREQVASLATRWMTAADSVKVSDLKIAGKTNVGIGEKVQFSVAGAKNVTWSVSGNGVIDQAGNFVGNASGNATVTAVADGKTLTATVNIYGVAKAVKIDVQKDLLSNGKSNEVITVYAVDANGYNVENFEGTATLANSNRGAAKFIAKSDLTSSTTYDGITTQLTSLTFKGGKAEFVAVAGKVPGLKDTATVSNLLNANGLAVSGFTAATADVKTVAQVATSIKVSASKSVISSNTNSDFSTVTAKVLDQDGKEMLTGTYGLKFNVSGVANWKDTNDQKEKAASFTGGVAAPNYNVNAVQGVTGSTTVTVTADGLTAGSVTITSAVAGNASKLTLADGDDTVDFVQGQMNNDITVGTTDANGTPSINYTIDGTKLIYAYVVDADGDNADNILINGTASSDNGVQLTGTSISLTTDGVVTPEAGSYKLIVKDQATSNALSTTELPFNVLADENSATKKLSFKIANNIVPASNPTTTVSAQVTDQFGNKLAKQDVAVTFTATTGGTTKAAFNGGSKLTAPNVTVNTDANGLATATFTADAYDNQIWTITPTVSVAGYQVATGKTVQVAYLVPASMGISLSATGTNSTYQVVAGSGIKIDLAQKDAYGNDVAVLNPNVKVTVASASGVNFPGATAGVTVDTDAGTITGKLQDVQTYLNAGFTARKAGTLTFTVENTSVAGVAAGSGVINVLPGAQTGFGLFDANGKLVSNSNKLKVEADKEVAVYVKPVDGQGNVVAANNDYTLSLTAGTGNFRLASNGAAVSTVKFPNGYASIALYFVNSTAGSYVPTLVAQPGAVSQVSLVGAASPLTFYTKDKLGTLVDADATPTVAVTGGTATATDFVVTKTATGTYSVAFTAPTADAVATTYTVTVSANGFTSGAVTLTK